ncbi:thioredoxin-disulfide reductase family protein [Tritrichomonas foetus]|uniref:Thioredoxin reductase n=1 Tax=Tritrichomonas foetus TaxID=1144522 RepID=A0A1J4KP01_9EUKA|nr:thioredoxin-disulfide reductase family protein [Tritrichomonas foetus]|eukprot:OHT11149.1 thioredoxin-disulfide reductase family protein [Tritrichomonas foetus]
MSAQQVDVVIIGSGPAGSTAALYLARAGYKPIVLHGQTPGGQLTGTTELENFPGWTGTGPDLVMKIEDQATQAGAEYRFEIVEECDLKSNPKKLKTDGENPHYEARAVIIATGANAVYLGLPNEERLKAKGVSGCATCDGPLYRGKDVIVVGGGDAAVEEALFLSHLAKSCKLVHRRDQLRATLPMRKKIEASTVECIWDSVVVDVLGQDKVTGVRLKNVKTNAETEVNCDGLFIAIGHSPATKPFRGQIECDQQGYIVTHGTPETSEPGVYACGDCADHVYRQAITSAGTGCQAALLCERYLMDHK